MAAPFRILTTTSRFDQNAFLDRLSGFRPFRVFVDMDAAQRFNGLSDLQSVLLRPECRRPANDLRLFCSRSIWGLPSRLLITGGRCIGKMQESPPSFTIKMTLHNILFGSFTPPKSTGRITHKLKDEETVTDKPKKKCPAPVQNQAERNDLSRGIPLSALAGTNKGRDRIMEILDDEEWMSWTRAVAGSGLS